ncbi:DNA alkylation repair protein [Sphingobacterium tabacisoli]|uniref:DNA alkylation repair protein n=1 Tax=Sphingobacterium tabacisoli TaxID=2044855 RepID=A0ABW5L652_9SPHI|nr:DNA alkylation repair protein [Sphingobacterium tabacisoli]
MEKINSKVAVSNIIKESLEVLERCGADEFFATLHKDLLKKKIRFPLLEFATRQIIAQTPSSKQIQLADRIIEMQEIGSQVLAGIILQTRLDLDFEGSIAKACAYIQYGNEWYVCDIIGERVLGYALLTNPERTIPVLQRLSSHEDKWIVRTVGVATHYAVKKGLDKSFVETVFQILLNCTNTTDFHTKKGIGWGAKTVARFHPDIVAKYTAQIMAPTTRQWFRTKINIGLNRNKSHDTTHLSKKHTP